MKLIIFRNIEELVNDIVTELSPSEFIEFNNKLKKITTPKKDKRKLLNFLKYVKGE